MKRSSLFFLLFFVAMNFYTDLPQIENIVVNQPVDVYPRSLILLLCSRPEVNGET